VNDPSKSTDEAVRKLEDKVKKLEEKVARLNTAVMGDGRAGISGLAERVVAIERKQRIHNAFTIKAMTAWTVGCGFVAFFKDSIWP